MKKKKRRRKRKTESWDSFDEGGLSPGNLSALCPLRNHSSYLAISSLQNPKFLP
jgi:hypothetical protein